MSETVHGWSDFSRDFPNSEKYLPPNGDGDSMGTQASTALCKLVYKWFNDGDVYDNNYTMEGWVNDISGSANWLYHYIPDCREVLIGINECINTDDYTNLLYNLCAIVDPMIPEMLNVPKFGNAYDEEGPFHFTEFVECPYCGRKVEPDDESHWDSDMDCCCGCADELRREEENEEDLEDES